MRIGELTAKAECDVQTARFYEREGLLEAPLRESSNRRLYAACHLERLHFIRQCRSLEVPLTEIRPRELDKQLRSLHARWDGDTPHASAILESFMGASAKQGASCYSATEPCAEAGRS